MYKNHKKKTHECKHSGLLIYVLLADNCLSLWKLRLTFWELQIFDFTGLDGWNVTFIIEYLSYSPSKIASIKIPTIMMQMNKYCFFVSFSFKKILDRIKDTTHTLERIGAAIAPFPLIAYTYVSCPAVSQIAATALSFCFGSSNFTRFHFIKINKSGNKRWKGIHLLLLLFYVSMERL